MPGNNGHRDRDAVRLANQQREIETLKANNASVFRLLWVSTKHSMRNAFEWGRKHPFATLALVSFIVTATLLTVGYALVPVIYVLSIKLGAFIGAIAGGYGGKKFMEKSDYDEYQRRNEVPNEKQKQYIERKSVMCGFAAGIFMFALCTFSPFISFAFCVAGLSFIVAGALYGLASYRGKDASGENDLNAQQGEGQEVGYQQQNRAMNNPARNPVLRSTSNTVPPQQTNSSLSSSSLSNGSSVNGSPNSRETMALMTGEDEVELNSNSSATSTYKSN